MGWWRPKSLAARLQSLESFLITSIKVILAVFVLICLFSLGSWIWIDDGGIIILPFETVNEGYNGQALADLLTYDLLRIKDIHGKEKDMRQPLSIGNYTIPAITPQGSSIDYSISNVGMLGQGPVVLSLGHILLTLKRLAPCSKPSPTLSCSLQRYGTVTVAVAIYDDGQGIESWEVVSQANLSEETPQLVQDLAYKVAHGLCLRNSRFDAQASPTEIQLARDWRAFGSITQAMEARQAYMETGDLGQLNLSRDKALDAKMVEPGYTGSSEVLSALGYEYSRNGLYDQALATFEEIAEDKPDSSAIGRGFVYLYLGDLNAALAAFDEATRIKPDEAGAWSNKGAALLMLGRYDEALIACDESIRIQPDDAAAWYNKGNALSDLGRNDEALIAYDEAIRIQPDYAEAWRNKGYTLSDLGRNDEALEACDEAIRLNPNDISAWRIKVLCLVILGRYDEALSALDETLRLQPKLAANWKIKGFVLSISGRNDEAREAYEVAMQIKTHLTTTEASKDNALLALGR